MARQTKMTRRRFLAVALSTAPAICGLPGIAMPGYRETTSLPLSFHRDDAWNRAFDRHGIRGIQSLVAVRDHVFLKSSSHETVLRLRYESATEQISVRDTGWPLRLLSASCEEGAPLVAGMTADGEIRQVDVDDLQTLGKFHPAADDGLFIADNITDLTMGPAGELFLTDGLQNQVHVCARDISRRVVIGSPGSANGRFCYPSSISRAVRDGKPNRLFVVDRGNARVVVVEDSGEHIALPTLEHVPYPTAACVSNGYAFVCGADGGLCVVDDDLRVVRTHKPPFAADLAREHCTTIAVSADYHIYMASDAARGTVVRWKPSAV